MTIGIFAASAAIGLGMAGCENRQGITQTTTQNTSITVYPSGHLVRERVSDDLTVGADFKQNIFFKTIIFSGHFDGSTGSDASITTTIQIPFADIKDKETLDKIAHLKTFYDQAMAAPKPATTTPAPR